MDTYLRQGRDRWYRFAQTKRLPGSFGGDNVFRSGRLRLRPGPL